MIARGLSDVRSVLCLGAHADDIEIGCGATLLRLGREAPAACVTWVVFGADEERAREAETSARMFLGTGSRHSVRVHAFPDRFFPSRWESIKAVFDALRSESEPDLVLTHRTDDGHQDHRVLAELTWNTWRDHWILEYEIPKYDGDLGRPNVYVPVPAADVERKISILSTAFPSQADKPWFRPETFRGLAAVRGLECRAAEGFAEAFHARKTVI